MWTIIVHLATMNLSIARSQFWLLFAKKIFHTTVRYQSKHEVYHSLQAWGLSRKIFKVNSKSTTNSDEYEENQHFFFMKGRWLLFFLSISVCASTRLLASVCLWFVSRLDYLLVISSNDQTDCGVYFFMPFLFIVELNFCQRIIILWNDC